MIIWAFVLIGIGIGALMDVSIWPMILIALGVSTFLTFALRRHPETARLFDCWQCWPTRFHAVPRDDREIRSD